MDVVAPDLFWDALPFDPLDVPVGSRRHHHHHHRLQQQQQQTQIQTQTPTDLGNVPFNAATSNNSGSLRELVPTDFSEDPAAGFITRYHMPTTSVRGMMPLPRTLYEPPSLYSPFAQKARIYGDSSGADFLAAKASATSRYSQQRPQQHQPQQFAQSVSLDLDVNLSSPPLASHHSQRASAPNAPIVPLGQPAELQEFELLDDPHPTIPDAVNVDSSASKTSLFHQRLISEALALEGLPEEPLSPFKQISEPFPHSGGLDGDSVDLPKEWEPELDGSKSPRRSAASASATVDVALAKPRGPRTTASRKKKKSPARRHRKRNTAQPTRAPAAAASRSQPPLKLSRVSRTKAHARSDPGQIQTSAQLLDRQGPAQDMDADGNVVDGEARRLRAVNRFLEKRKRRNWCAKPQYRSRQRTAATRMRAGGRFIKTVA